jgi:hypothetical protein
MRRIRACVYAAALLACAGVHAANAIPEFTGDWVNGGPYTKAGLHGKAVLFFLMEMG